MRPKDRALANEIESKLQELHLPGIEESCNRNSLLEQLIESIHRVKYVSLLLIRPISSERANPQSELFDPLKAAIFWSRQGNVDEAYWMVFIFVHFGKHKVAGWQTAHDVYGGLGMPSAWDWERTSSDPQSFRQWLAANHNRIPCRFGNHRKYQSLKAWTSTGTGAAFESYISWVKKFGNHEKLIKNALDVSENSARRAFNYLYRSMKDVRSFGRTARFDYLTMIAKLQLAPIEADSTYLQGATGPYEGARLLFGGSKKADLSRKELDEWLIELEELLGVGMQVLEDALCNWQKSPERFEPFRG